MENVHDNILLFTIEVENHHFYFLTVVFTSDIPQGLIFLKEDEYVYVVSIFCSCFIVLLLIEPDGIEPDY